MMKTPLEAERWPCLDRDHIDRVLGFRLTRVLSVTLVLAGVGLLPSTVAIAADFSFRGNFSADDDVRLFSFVTDGASAVVLRTYSYGGGVQADGTVIPADGFDPVLEVFDAEGSRVDGNDDGTDLEVAADPLTDAAVDVYLAASLSAGTYTVAIAQYDNHAIGPTLADGFTRAGLPTFTSGFQCSNGQFCDYAGYDRTSFWAFDILGAEAATTGVPDRDLDAIPDASDNCPTVANPLQQDGGGGTESGAPAFDGVGNACDNCTNVNNPRVPGWTLALGSSAFLSANPWGTLTGGQRDDDHDGFGNICDGDFNNSLTITAADSSQYKASLSKPKIADSCGTPNVRPCAIFDLNSANSTESSATGISAADTARYKLLLGAVPGPKCAACTGTGSVPLPCEQGTAGTCF